MNVTFLSLITRFGSRTSRISLGIFLAAGSVLSVLAQTFRSTEAVRLSREPVLFVDDSSVASMVGLVRTIHPAKTHPAPVVEPERPWEEVRVYTYGSVMRDPATGGFRLWYMAHSRVLYATSADGISWNKPSLGVQDYEGSKANNIVFLNLHSPSVIEDRATADPAKRLRMIGNVGGKYYGAYSADGIRWYGRTEQPLFLGTDTNTLTQDPRTGEFMAFFKKKSNDVPGRVVWLTRSRDFVTWSEPKLVFHADEEDNRWAKGPGQGTEVYNMSVVPHATGFLGFPTIFRVMERLSAEVKLGNGQSRFNGPIDVQLATSTDGEHWARTTPRVNVVPRGVPGSFDGGAILGVTSTVVDSAEETWMLYTAINTGHGGPIPPKRLTLGRATWRLHGFASLDAGPTGGQVLTRPLLISGGKLLINADASRGRLRMALMEVDGGEVPGFGLGDFEVLQTNATKAEARWKTGRDIPTDRPFRVVIELSNSRLYSLTGTAGL